MKLNSALQMIILFVFMIAIFQTKVLLGYFILLAIVIILFIKTRYQFSKIIHTLAYLLLFVTVFYLASFYSAGTKIYLTNYLYLNITIIAELVTLFMRLFLVISITGIYTTINHDNELVLAIKWLLKPLTYLKVDIEKISFTILLAFRFITDIEDQFKKLRIASTLRGYNLKYMNKLKSFKYELTLIPPLIVGTFNQADQVALALTARHLNFDLKRSSYEYLNFNLLNVTLTFIYLLLLMLYIYYY